MAALREKEPSLAEKRKEEAQTKVRHEYDDVLELASQQLAETEDGGVKDPWEFISLMGHAYMTSYGFDLIGLTEGHAISSEKVLRVLPKEWNDNTTYVFKYAHPEGSPYMKYLLKIRRLGDDAVIHSLAAEKYEACETKNLQTTNVNVQNFVNPERFPLPHRDITSDSLKKIFKSEPAIDEFFDVLNANLTKIAPKIMKPFSAESYSEDEKARGGHDYSYCGTKDERAGPAGLQEDEPETAEHRAPLPKKEQRDTQTTSPGRRQEPGPGPTRPLPREDPLAVPARRTGPVPDFAPPGFEDEHGINQPPGPALAGGQPRFGPRPPNLGERDLYPQGMGPNDPFRPHIGPEIRPGGGGGMHPTFDDPLFGGDRGDEGFSPEAPAGARWDPVNPGQGPPRMGRGGFPPGSGRGGRG
ncbi:hypothetical protein KEM55_006932, partial [Ascosphaera atra]